MGVMHATYLSMQFRLSEFHGWSRFEDFQGYRVIVMNEAGPRISQQRSQELDETFFKTINLSGTSAGIRSLDWRIFMEE